MKIPEKNVAVGVGVGVGAVLAGYWAWRRFSTPPLPHTWEKVGVVSEVTIYPLKSARGIQLQEAQATIYGLKSDLLEDRSFMVMKEDGSYITNRQAGMLTTVVTHMKGHTLTLKAKDIEDVTVDLERDLKHQPVVEANMKGLLVQGVDCGDKVAQWLTRVLYKGETKVRLMYKGDVLKNRPARKPDYFEFKHYRKSDRVLYADNCGYMLSCQSSLDDLNTRLSEPVTMETFRQNIVVTGSEAYDEDDWVFVKIGEVILRRLKPCDRCISTVVSPETGERHPKMEPLTTLKGYRLLTEPPELAKAWAAKPVFGIKLGIDVTGTIAVGDKVSIARASVHPHLKGF